MVADVFKYTFFSKIHTCFIYFRALQDFNEDQEPLSKRPALRGNSEDLFGSQHLNNSNSNIETLSANKTAISNKCQQEPVKVNHVPSLDMFAPSGQGSVTSSVHKETAVAPSCEDMFASSGSRKQGSKNLGDEFSVSKTKTSKEPLYNANSRDEFSFDTAKKESYNVVDEFSFNSNKPSNASVVSEIKGDDAFSFTSNKRPNKRNRQSTQDMFVSSAESSIINDDSIAGPSKSVNDFSFSNSKPNAFKDNLFAFPDDHNPKRRRINDEELGLNKTESDIKLAVHTNGCETEPGTICMKEVEDLSEPKHLITYSKVPTKVKEVCKQCFLLSFYCI